MFIFNLYATATVGGDGGARSEGSTDADATDDVPRTIRHDRKEKLGMPPV